MDRTFEQIAAGVTRAGFEPVIDIDHARLAAEAGGEMPSSRVQLFSDAAVNSALLSQNLSAGLDLPFRALTYAGADAVQVSYTSADFLKRRYGLDDTEALALGVDLPPAMLLLFGGPAPVGVAMAKFPSIGVDAFCQKLFVHAKPEGCSMELFNSNVALAELH